LKGRSKALRIHELLDAEDPIVAADKRSAAAQIVDIVNQLERGDLEHAWSTARSALDVYPLDPVLAFYREAIGTMLQTGEGYEGALELREK
jgi:hypothetical protein